MKPNNNSIPPGIVIVKEKGVKYSSIKMKLKLPLTGAPDYLDPDIVISHGSALVKWKENE